MERQTTPLTLIFSLQPNIRFGQRPIYGIAYSNQVIDYLEKAIELNPHYGIVEANRWERLLYFSIGCNPGIVSGLEPYFQLWGLVNKLLPVRAAGTKDGLNPEVIERILLNPDNFKNFSDVEEQNMPRISGILGNY